jgi:hypothetical protein
LKPIKYGGQVMTLNHLAPITFDCPCPDIGRPLSIRAHFTSHCYTEEYDPDVHALDQIVLREGGKKGQVRFRVFCPVRYELSHQLPTLITSLPDNQKVHGTAEGRNYVHVVSLSGRASPYEIYFMLQRADGTDLRLTVESAYCRDEPSSPRKRPNTIRFVVLARKVYTRQPVRFTPR